MNPHARPLAALLLFASLCSSVWAQTAPLNDTGQTQCYNASNAVAPCNEATTGNNGVRPGQDARYGRDPAHPIKTGGGAAGFDFTALDASGIATAPGSHVCVRDNTTKLWWEVKQSGAATLLRHQDYTYTWYDGSTGDVGSDTCNATLPGGQCNTQAYVTAVNTANLCGHNDWRLPTEGELQSIVHYGATSNPAIETTYFPFTQVARYWTSETYAADPSLAWYVHFDSGFTFTNGKTVNDYVRVVRSGP